VIPLPLLNEITPLDDTAVEPSVPTKVFDAALATANAAICF